MVVVVVCIYEILTGPGGLPILWMIVGKGETDLFVYFKSTGWLKEKQQK